MPAIAPPPSPSRAVVIALAMLGLAPACQSGPPCITEACLFEPEGLELELSDGTLIEYSAEIIAFNNYRGESLQGVLVRPNDSSEPKPAVVIMHGSGGLFSTPDSNDTKLEVTDQYTDWASLLADRGYPVLLPSSFYSRGYFEWDDRPEPRIDKVERNIMRVHDAYGALRYMCAQAFVDCSRVGSMGFSNGGSVAMLAQHEGLDEVSGMSSLPLTAERDRFVVTTLYYPGCNLQGLVPGDYFPTAPLDIQHGSDDSLLEHCPDRLARTLEVSEARALDSTPMSMTVHEGAGHGFDGDPRNSDEERARDQARTFTLDRFDAALKP